MKIIGLGSEVRKRLKTLDFDDEMDLDVDMKNFKTGQESHRPFDPAMIAPFVLQASYQLTPPLLHHLMQLFYR